MTTLAEKYRPARWEDVVGQEKVIRRIQAMMARGPMSGRSYYIEGKSGVGKTTIARLLAAEVADPMNINELDAGALNVTTLRQIEDDAQTYGMGGKNGRSLDDYKKLIQKHHNSFRAALMAIESGEMME